MFSFRASIRNLFSTHYQTLKVGSNATDIQIKQSYKDLVKKSHPDTGAINTSEQFVRIRNAYETLRDPYLRRIYDREVFPQKQQLVTRNFHYYGQDRSVQNSPTNEAVNLVQLIGLLGICAFLVYCAKLYIQPMTQHEIRRQNILLANQNIDDSPSTQQKRRKKYALEMKEKKFSANVIKIKVGTGCSQSTKAKLLRKNSIQSIPGISKENQEQAYDYTRQKYI